MMEERAKEMVLGVFVADALALGVHWIYDTGAIKKTFGRVDDFIKPAADGYHATKEKGEFTHYGDQAFVLLQSVAAKKAFDLQDFSSRWRSLFKGYGGYVDQATRTTLSHYEAGKAAEEAGSPSDDLAGASRIAPAVYCYRHDLDKLVKASRSQTKMTHNNEFIIDSAEYFARLVWLILGGTKPVEAMRKVARDHFAESPLSDWVSSGIESRDEESVQAIADFGQSCHVHQAFPGVVHLISKCENDLEEALVQAVMAGGDSAARGMLVGMILGAHLGLGSLPEKWLSQLKKREQIMDLLDGMP